MVQFSIKRIPIVILDLAIATLSCLIAYLFFKDAGYFSKNIHIFVSITLGLTLIIFWVFRLYNNMWKYAGITELTNVVLAVVLITLINIIICLASTDDDSRYVPIRAILVTGFVQMTLTIISRYIYRIITVITRESNDFLNNDKERVMLIGAGSAGISLVHEMRSNKASKYYPVCFIDDDTNKIGNYIENVKVVGNRNKIVEKAKKYRIDKIVISMPSIDPKELSQIIKICQETKCSIQTMPSIYQLMDKTI